MKTWVLKAESKEYRFRIPVKANSLTEAFQKGVGYISDNIPESVCCCFVYIIEEVAVF